MIAGTASAASIAPPSAEQPGAGQLSPRLLRLLPIHTLDNGFWRFLSASVFFDFGFGLFFFLFNLYLATAHFDDRSIGLFTSAFTIGSMAATGVAGFVARRHGLRPLLAVCMFLAPAVGVMRTFALQPTAQWLASFLLGTAMCGWAICTPTALARVTADHNRSLGFSLNFATGIGAGVLAGLIGGALPAKLVHLFALSDVTGGMRITLVLGCLLVIPGALPLARRGFLAHAGPGTRVAVKPRTSRFLFRFLAAFGVWSAVTAGFGPFANLYLMRRLGIPLPRIGQVFAMSQFIQVVAVLAHRFFIEAWAQYAPLL